MHKTVLITGASGYIGGKLIERLKGKVPLRALFRRAQTLEGVECIQGDLLDKKGLEALLKGVDTAFYLVHSMGSGGDFVKQDRIAASNFGQVAARQGVRRIIYLGGLGGNEKSLSAHLRSRHEVGQVLRNAAEGVSVIEFRASIIIGAGSLSYEMIRALVNRLPFMITPKWVWTKAQPIAIKDVLDYLTAAIELKVEDNPIYEIGGKDKVSYGEIMQEYGRQKGLNRKMLYVPLLSPRLSSLWLALVTPLYAKVGRKLIDSASNETVVHDPAARGIFKMSPMSLKEAIAAAIKEDQKQLRPKLFDIREAWVDASPDQAFSAVEAIGGVTGYYYGNFLWKLRGLLDACVGGVGFRRGRKDPDTVQVGEVVDFWRVEALEPGKRLRLKAEMKLPGEAWLEFSLKEDKGGTVIKQSSLFYPDPFWGSLYWYILYPVHHLIFNGMLKGLCHQIERNVK